jgi:tol-pal system protein YbgF
VTPPAAPSALPPRGAPPVARQNRFHGVRLGALVVSILCLTPAHAGLFDDEEARKAILELRNRITAMEDQGKARSAELTAANSQNAQLNEQLASLRRSLLDLNNQLEAMRGEIAKLRGTDEQMLRDLADAQKRQRDFAQAFDERLKKTEPVKVSLDGREFSVEPEEKRAYDEAFGVIRTGDFDRAVALFSNFQRRYPGSPYADAARFWLGNSQYGRRDYKQAIEVFRSFVSNAPEHPRAPEAMLAMANSQAEMKDPRGARKTIEELMKAYPQSEAAQAGKERLASIK